MQNAENIKQKANLEQQLMKHDVRKTALQKYVNCKMKLMYKSAENEHSSTQNSCYFLMSSTNSGTESKHSSTQNSGYFLMSSTKS